jgi:5'-3' exonuclease
MSVTVVDTLNETPVILFDEGYLFHYRFHATKRNLSFRKEPSTDDEIVETFEKHLRQQLEKTKKKFKTTRVYFALDAKCSNVWRMEHLDCYKATRPDNDPIMKKIYPVFSKVLTESGEILSHPNLESDDIIAIIAKNIHKLNPKLPIQIITGDNDFLQLKKYDSVQIYKGNLTETLGSGNPETDMLIKICSSDPSDNIKGFASKKKVLDLIASNKLDELINKNEKNKQIYERNRLLIDFDRIPQNLVDDFLKTIEFKC